MARRLVVIGRKLPEHKTMYWTIEVKPYGVLALDPVWIPQSDPNAEPDYDEMRKIKLESSEDEL